MKHLKLLIACSLFMLSCNKDSDSLLKENFAKGDNNGLKGRWERDFSNYTCTVGEPALQFLFEKDSFYLKIEHSFLDYPSDTCTNEELKEYAKGTYQLQNGHLILDGYYTDSLFQRKISASGCYTTIGDYKKNHTYSRNEDAIVLDEQLSGREIYLVQIK